MVASYHHIYSKFKHTGVFPTTHVVKCHAKQKQPVAVKKGAAK